MASRGLDIDDVTHVFNYDFPKDLEEYVHRSALPPKALVFFEHIRRLCHLGHYCQDWPHWEGRQERHKYQPLGEEGLEESWRAGGFLVKSLHSLLTMVQVSIMEEAGQDVPNWLRGEADRFKNHQVDITLELRLTMLLT